MVSQVRTLVLEGFLWLMWRRLPSHVTLESAALLEPLSVAIHATRRATIEPGDTAVVFGAGTVGLLTAAMAKLNGATSVLIADIDSGRVEYALQQGFATKGYVVTTTSQSDDIWERMEKAKDIASEIVETACAGQPDREGVEVTFDCTGKEMCMQAGLYVCSPRITLAAC